MMIIDINSKGGRSFMRSQIRNLVCWLMMCTISVMLNTIIQAQSVLPDLAKLDWLIVGPFAIPAQTEKWADVQGFQTDYLAEIGGEAQAQPQEGQTVQGKVWQRVRSPQMPVNLNGLFGYSQDCVAYAYVEFESSTAQAVALKLGSDDGLKVWFNGKLLVSDHVHRSLQIDEDGLTLNLQAGLNRLLLKIDQGSGEWSFSARLSSLEDDAQAWKAVAAPQFKICPLEQVVFNPEEFVCTVLTVPGFAVQEPVEIVVADEQGKPLITVSGQTGELIPLPLPKTFTGIVSLNVSGTGKTTGVTAQEAILVGDVDRMSQDLVRLARAQADQVTDKIQGDVLAATLTFCADVLERKVHSSLATVARTILSIKTLQTLTTLVQQNAWNVDAFKGLHPWAYRSAIDDALQPFTLYVPADYDATKRYGLIVALHGYTGNDYDAAATIIKPQLQPNDFLVVAPFGRGDVGYLSIGEQDVLDVIDRIQASFRVDPDRIYLMGWSMGGLGTWRIGQFFADKFAAMAPFCGWTGTDYLVNLYNLPVLIVHGDADNSVPVAMDRAAAEQLKQWHYPVQYDELPGVGHDAWGAWVKETGGNRVLDYFRQYWRNPWPAEVIVKTNYLRYGKNFWARILELARPPQNGYLKASFVDATHITVVAEQVNVFSLNLTYPQLSQTAPIIVEINGTALMVEPAQVAATFRYQETVWSEVKEQPATGSIPHDGGGISDLFVRPLIIVYGTQQRGEIYQKAATIFADWSPTPQIGIGSKTGGFHVKADTDITAEDMQKYNLLLFGGPEHNLITKQLADKLPVEFSEDKVTINGQEFSPAGMMLTCPNPLAPTKLVGIMTFPIPDEEVLRLMARASLIFRGYNVDGSGAVPRFLPDVIVYNSFEQQNPFLWMGWFDYTWQHLRKYQ
jgi:pimeloyl-ACP methyl ester carboxylesterase